MPKKDRKMTINFNTPVTIGVLAVITGILLLIVSNYMRTDVTFSAAETTRATIVNVLGRAILIIGLLIVGICFVKRAARDLFSNK